MATFTSDELTKARNFLERREPVHYQKATANAAFQAIEDAMLTLPIPGAATGLTVAAYLSQRIDAATTPTVLSVQQKKLLNAYWAYTKYLRDSQ